MDQSGFEVLVEKDKIREIMSRYARLADEKKWIQFAGLFMPDGSFTPLDVSGTAILSLKGREQIADTLARIVGHATAIHHLFSYEISIQDSAVASGVFSMEDYLIYPENGEISPVSVSGSFFREMHGFGHYHADFTRVEGEWFISKLVQTRIKIDYTY